MRALRDFKTKGYAPDLYAGQTLHFKVLCKFITDGWVTPEDIWTSFQGLGKQDFMKHITWTKETSTVHVVIPDRYLGDDSGSNNVTTQVEVTGRVTVQEGKSGLSQLLDYVQSLSADDVRSGMTLSLHVRVPLQPDEDSTATEEYGENPALAERPARRVAKRPSPVLPLVPRRATFPPLPNDIEDRTEVKVSNIEGAGRGLFAKYNMRKGSTVAAMKSPSFVTLEQKRSAVKKGLPKDMFFHIDTSQGRLKGKRGKFFLTDESFKDPREPPKWYYLNHGASSANSIFKYDDATNDATWVAKYDIPQGSELYFNYSPGEKTSF
jgi:hypothetical protein